MKLILEILSFIPSTFSSSLIPVFYSVTLFVLMFGYTWFFLMDRYAKLVGSWSRVYFMSFYIISTIILTIVVSSILEAFSFTMKCKRKLSDIEGEHFFFFF